MASFNPNFTIPVVPFTADLAASLSFGPTPPPPIIMFPVRLETRFFPVAGRRRGLARPRLPGQSPCRYARAELTEEEVIWGKHFWEQTWRAASDEEAKRAWRQLVERFDANRAAWVARTLRPLNPEDRPAQPLRNEQPLTKPISFPAPATKAAAWTRAPFSNVLPKRWCVFCYAGGNLVVRAMGNLIPDKLPTGPDPSASPDEFADGDLAIDGGMKWMVDFAEAEKVGMGIRLRLTVDQFARGFDILLVFGTKAAPDVTDGTPDLVRLLDAHHYTDGLNFVPQGTPSNNTPDAPSGFNSSDPGQEESYLAERSGAGFQSGDESNADALTVALGLRDGNALTLANLGHANAKEQLDARHMNRALWSATLGYFLGQMIGRSISQETPFTLENFADHLSWARRHFIDYVRAAGPLPAMPVGRQPYGVLAGDVAHAGNPKPGKSSSTRATWR